MPFVKWNTMSIALCSLEDYQELAEFEIKRQWIWTPELFMRVQWGQALSLKKRIRQYS